MAVKIYYTRRSMKVPKRVYYNYTAFQDIDVYNISIDFSVQMYEKYDFLYLSHIMY